MTDFRPTKRAALEACIALVLERHGFLAPAPGDQFEVALEKILACLLHLSDRAGTPPRHGD